MIVIGITGTNGAGKGTVVDYLVNKKEFLHLSVSGLLSEILQKEGKAADRKNLIDLGNNLRKKHGPDYLAKTLLKRARMKNINCIIESIRTTSEAKALLAEKKSHLFAIDADPVLRYKRIRQRGSSKDSVSFKEFIEYEKKELESSDPTKQHIAKCMEMADYTFLNNGSLGDLHQEIEKALENIENS